MLLADLPDLPVTTSSLRFFQDDERFRYEKPYHFSGPLEAHEESHRTNLILKLYDKIPISDLRACPSRARLDIHGFQFETYRSKFVNALHDPQGLASYMEEVACFVKELEGAEAVICFDYRFRKSASIPGQNIIGAGGSYDLPNEPAWQVHVDSTRAAGHKRARYHLCNTEYEKYLDGSWRIRIINAWRPLNRVVKDSPLAFCDSTSFDETDLVATDRPSREYVGEVYYMRYNDSQKWYWLSQQTPDELSLFMSYDSDPGDHGAAFCPHTAFLAQDGLPPEERRESLEIRMIIVSHKVPA